MSPASENSIATSLFDAGHQGEVDLTQIRRALAMTPTERLRKHEQWRLFVKEAVRRAKLRRADAVLPLLEATLHEKVAE